MVKFEICDYIKNNCPNVAHGYEEAEKYLNDPVFLSLLLDVERYTYTKDTPSMIYNIIRNFVIGKDTVIKIEKYWYKNSRVVATTFSNVPNTIYINMNGVKMRRPSDYLENGCHEFGHIAKYGHGGNFPNGWRARMMGDFADKELSVPYVLANMASHYAGVK